MTSDGARAHDDQTVAREEDAAILDAVGKWLERDVRPHVLELEHADTYPAEMVEQMKALGLFGATIATELRRARALRHHLRQDRAEGLGGVDVARRHLQLAPDHGGLRAARRHRGAEAPVPAALRHRRAARRPGPHRARLRHRPAGDPHPRRALGQRRLRRQRHQDLDLQRHPRPGVRPAGQDRPQCRAAPQGHEHAAGRRRGRASASPASSRSSATRASIPAS